MKCAVLQSLLVVHGRLVNPCLNLIDRIACRTHISTVVSHSGIEALIAVLEHLAVVVARTRVFLVSVGIGCNSNVEILCLLGLPPVLPLAVSLILLQIAVYEVLCREESGTEAPSTCHLVAVAVVVAVRTVLGSWVESAALVLLEHNGPDRLYACVCCLRSEEVLVVRLQIVLANQVLSSIIGNLIVVLGVLLKLEQSGSIVRVYALV